MKGGQRQSIEFNDFSGGQVTKSPPKNIENKFSPDCLNVYSEGAILRPRDGIAPVNATAATGTGYGLYNWFRGSAATNQWLVSFWGTNLMKMDVVTGAWDGNWDAIVADAASGTAFTAGTMYFANFNGVLLMSTENRDTVQKITSSDASYFDVITGGTGTAPACKYLTVWKNHAWYLNLVNSEDQIVHSSVNSYNNFTGDTYGTNTMLTENDIGLTGVFILNGRMYVTKAFSIHRFTYTGSPSPLVDIRDIKGEIGTRSPKTIKRINTSEGDLVLFLGTNRRLYLCDGIDTDDVSDSIDLSNGESSVYMQNINASALNNCHAVVHENLNWYELFICVGTSTVPTHSVVYDYRLKAFWPMDNRNFTASVDADNGSRQRAVYAMGSADGVMYLLNSTGSDDGSSINSYWTSPKIGNSITLDRIDEVEVETASVVCTPTFSWRADWDTTWTDNTMVASTNSHNYDPGRIDNLIQFKIANNSTQDAFKLWSILGSEKRLGIGK